ncbi:MAG: N-acetyl-gamma-glutamyl-phosphate reductase, partial [Caldilinea sp.]
MIVAGIAGATGYTGIELVQLLHRHPQVTIGWITSASSAGKRLCDVHAVPWQYTLIALDEAYARAGEVDVVFLCLPHGQSIEAARRFAEAGIHVIDLSADFRLGRAEAYQRWYGLEHTVPELLPHFVYGLCEVNREQLRGARLIAVPGCYPTTVNLGLYPLAKAGWLGERVIIDSKSGISGAGRTAKLPYMFVESNENMTPYNIGYRHRHIAEMDMIVTATSGAGQKVLDIMKVKPGCVITDVARPLDLPPEEVVKRPDVLVIESGEIQLPGEPKMKNIGLPPGVTYACLAETIVLALEG